MHLRTQTWLMPVTSFLAPLTPREEGRLLHSATQSLESQHWSSSIRGIYQAVQPLICHAWDPPPLSQYTKQEVWMTVSQCHQHQHLWSVLKKLILCYAIKKKTCLKLSTFYHLTWIKHQFAFRAIYTDDKTTALCTGNAPCKWPVFVTFEKLDYSRGHLRLSIHV